VRTDAAPGTDAATDAGLPDMPVPDMKPKPDMLVCPIPDAGPSDAPPDALAFTWTNSLQSQFTAFCGRCHSATTVGFTNQNFTCQYCYDPSTGACATSLTQCGSATVPGVSQFEHTIICGILPASTASYCGCPDPRFRVPFGQFPADCQLDNPSNWGPMCPTDTQRQAIVHWINSGAQ
jgi:hypothetical protein